MTIRPVEMSIEPTKSSVRIEFLPVGSILAKLFVGSMDISIGFIVISGVQ